MENSMSVADHALGVDRRMRLRISAVVAALALAFTMFVFVQDRADASPRASVAASAVANPTDVAAQIDFGQIFCSILQTIFSAFSSSPFFSFIAAALTPILQAFGCVVS